MQPSDQKPQTISAPQVAPQGHISAVEAAARFNLSNDYIASLARKGKVEGSLVGRSWYVKEGSLKSYIEQMGEERRLRKSSLSEKLKREYKARILTVPVLAQIQRAPHKHAPQPAQEKPRTPQIERLPQFQAIESPFRKRESREHLTTYALAAFFIGTTCAFASYGSIVVRVVATNTIQAASAVLTAPATMPLPDLTLPDKTLFVEALGDNGLAIWDKTFGALGAEVVALSQTNAGLGLSAVAALYAPPAAQPEPAQKTQTVFKTENVKLVAATPTLDINALAQAGSQVSVAGSIAFESAARASHYTPKPASAAVRAKIAERAQAAQHPVSAQTSALSTPSSIAIVLVSVPYQFLYEMVGGLMDETAASYSAAVYALDVASDAQNNFYTTFVAAADAAPGVYAEYVGNFSAAFVQAVNPVGDTAANVYGTAGDIFVTSVDQVGDAQANAYIVLANAVSPTSNFGGVSQSGAIALSAATIQAMPDTYAALIGGIGTQFVNAVNTITDTYASVVGTIGSTFVQDTNTTADIYAAAVGTFSQGFLTWANAMADSQAAIYGMLGAGAPHAWDATFGGFGQIFVASVDDVGDAQAYAYQTLAGAVAGNINQGTSNFSTAAALQAADTQSGWNLVWDSWTGWLAHTILYSAQDQAGNVGTATRTVNVVNPNASSTPQQ